MGTKNQRRSRAASKVLEAATTSHTIRMRIALVLTPLTDTHLALAAQVGASDIVARYPGTKREDLLNLKDRIARFGLRLSVIEGYIPHDLIVHGKPGRDQQIATICELIQNMAEAEIPILCYNFMPDDDWSRTETDARERGGARVTSFDADRLAGTELPAPHGAIRAEQLWRHLEYFLEKVVPVAETQGVRLAVHPDDPPMSPLRGQDRILTSVEAFERLIGLSSSPANGICFCQGCFASMGVSITDAIRRLGHRIHYVHFRDVVGSVPRFRESFQDNGQSDMFAALKAYRAIGFSGPIRPDHVPMLEGETASATVQVPFRGAGEITIDTHNGPDVPVPPGYTMLGRLFAVGYMRGLIEALNATE